MRISDKIETLVVHTCTQRKGLCHTISQYFSSRKKLGVFKVVDHATYPSCPIELTLHYFFTMSAAIAVRNPNVYCNYCLYRWNHLVALKVLLVERISIVNVGVVLLSALVLKCTICKSFL